MNLEGGNYVCRNINITLLQIVERHRYVLTLLLFTVFQSSTTYTLLYSQTRVSSNGMLYRGAINPFQIDLLSLFLLVNIND